MLERLEKAISLIPDSRITDWTAYSVKNDLTNLDRLRMWLPDGSEFQINRIWHAIAPHFHRSSMISKIIRYGYWWQLNQDGAKERLRLFASPGSIVSLAPNDVHLIEQCSNNRPSISFCLFDAQYPELDNMSILPVVDAEELLTTAKVLMEG